MNQDGQRKIVLVGHCVPDSFMLKGVIERAIPGAMVVRANSDEELGRESSGAALLVVNRVLDGEFADTSGLSVVRSAVARRARAMLISNFPESRAEAEAAGGLPSFGKKDAGAEETVHRLRAAVER
ncbi:MAG: hypothetical protein KF699_08830 [Phycisphaeraceae bacterium]|nr:hypothetical protein [Phycisphaeraceae bacterium]MBX3406286.1 hypothetical protein [Phycisphaeraceae bacterium]